jgi:hypothetical protein
MKITLDHNCLIALEKNESEAPYIKELIAMHDDKKVIVRVVGIGASELQPGRVYASNFSEFKEKIAAVGLGQAEILVPIGYWDITFWDNCIYPSEEASRLEREIHDVLFPKIEFDYQTFCHNRGLDPLNSGKLGEMWRNKKCDVLTIWSHIFYSGDIFVTADIRAFLSETKKPRLIGLGAGDILSPQYAVAKIELMQG